MPDHVVIVRGFADELVRWDRRTGEVSTHRPPHLVWKNATLEIHDGIRWRPFAPLISFVEIDPDSKLGR